MRIREDVKLDFCDVLFEPKMSDLPSRLDVDLTRRFTFLNSEVYWEGIPIIAANMACTGTFAMAEALGKFKLTTALHKHYTLEDLVSFYEKEEAYRAWYTIGIRDEDLEKLATFKSIQTGCMKPELLCIDVANGYTKNFIAKCREIREKYPNSVIMAGNVCTPDLVQELLLNGGVDIVKVGIGPGCFVAGTKVLTENGPKPIEEVEVGESVVTHRGNLKKVRGKLERTETDCLISVNGVKCTDNHEFYVLHKKYKAIVTDENIDEYTQWIEAKNLTKDYLLLKFSQEHLDKLGVEPDSEENVKQQNEINGKIDNRN